jgi:hypothetical protein
VSVLGLSCRILWSFKLNPYERLNLRFTATPEEIRKQFRKLSLMVHPDKCKHPQASEAFDSKCAYHMSSLYSSLWLLLATAVSNFSASWQAGPCTLLSAWSCVAKMVFVVLQADC